MQKRSSWEFALCVAVVMMGLGGATARADLVDAEGRPMAANVEIRRLHDGELVYQLPGGREVKRGLGQIRFLQIAGWERFNEAEKLQRDRDYVVAVQIYEELLAAAMAEPAGGLDRPLLLRCRLLRAYDAQGRFDLAVKLYVELLPRMPAAVEQTRPVNLPAAGSTLLPDAARHLEQAIASHRDQPWTASVLAWRESWPDRASSATPRPASSATDVQIQTAGPVEADARLSRLDGWLRTRQWESALTEVQNLLAQPAGLDQAVLFLAQARAWAGRSTALEGEAALTAARRAGVAAMRVVIHFPRHPRASEAIGLAATLARQQGMPAAEQLADEAQRMNRP